MSRVLLGVTGGIAAYKACELLRRLAGSGHEVTVVPTAAALEFVGAATWAALSGRPVHTSVFDDAHLVPHVKLGRETDLVLVAPATADLLARAATGRADDLLTNVLLTARGPVVYAPAMHTEMWQHPATQANVELLRQRGAVVVDPDNGRLTGPDSGPGRLPDPVELWAVATSILADPMIARRAAEQDMAGLTVAVSAGGTREHLDPVRFLGNASSGLMGWALARAAALRGAAVRLVAANVAAPPPPNVEVDRVTSTAELASGMEVAAKGADVVVMAAAPADFTPVDPRSTKIKKSGDGGLDARAGPDHRRAGRPGRGPDRPTAGAGRLRRGDPIRLGFPDGARPGQARPQGLRPAGAERGRTRPGVRSAGQRGHHPRWARTGRPAGREQGHAGPPHLG